jgi:DNA-binding MarR family transcriptional regulator
LSLRDDEFMEAFGSVSRRVRGVAADTYAELELGATQAKFIRHLGKNGASSQAELARWTGTDPALTGRVVACLLARGWARRTRSTEDRRQYVVDLTPAGWRIQKRVERAGREIARRILRLLDERDHADFRRIARKIHSAFEAG